MLLLPPSLLRAFARAAFRYGGRAHRAAERASRPAAAVARDHVLGNVAIGLAAVAYWTVVAGWLTGALPD